MRLLLTITVASLALAGCAGNYDKSAGTNLCEFSIPDSQAAANQLSPSINVPARTLLSTGKLDLDDTTAYMCVDPKNKTNAPQVPNLHKIRLDHLSAAT
jgi:hypothetical protein